MHRILSVKLGDLNTYLKCPLCKGFLIDSYTINECLHSFCKSCIIKYIKRKECCPICKINIIKDRMSLFLKRDVNLQCIVYKLVPELFKREMKRRRDFYSTHPKALKFLKKKKLCDKETTGQLEDDDMFLLDNYTDISLSIEYSETGLTEICDSARYKELDPASPKSYLQCPASFTIELLKKFISIKLGLKTVKNLDVMYDDKPLSKDLTLVDIAYIYAWRRTAPMRLFYRVKDQDKADCGAKVDENVPEPIEAASPIIHKETLPNVIQIVDTFHEDEGESIDKPTAKSTPQKDLSITHESANNEVQNNTNKTNFLTLNNTTQNLISNPEGLTITAMVESITNLNKLETVSNSDKENDEESHVIIKSDPSDVQLPAEISEPLTLVNTQKVKKQKVIKPKSVGDDEALKPAKKKPAPKSSGENNPTKKPKLSQSLSKKQGNTKSLEDQNQNSDQQFNIPFTNKLNFEQQNPQQPVAASTPQIPIMPPNFQLMPMSLINSMYPWKQPFDYSQQQLGNYQGYPQAGVGQSQAQQTNVNPQAFFNQKYASQIFDYFQTKASQSFYQGPHDQGQGQSQIQSHQMPHHHHQQQHQYQLPLNNHMSHFTQFNYMDEFKKPGNLANFASLIQEAASYQSNMFGAKSFGEKSVSGSEAGGVDSLTETQMKISESCSLVNDS